jgi:hypothetical protein
MDISLAKGLTKELFRQIPLNLDKKLDLMLALYLRSKKVSSFINKYNQLLDSNWNNFSIHHAVFGNKKKMSIGFTILDIQEIHHYHLRDENLLISQQMCFDTDTGKIEDKPNPDFAISHHVIQRLFQRNKNFETNNYEEIFTLIKHELQFVSFWSQFWNTLLLTFTILTEKENLSLLSIPIPTCDGLLFGHFPDGQKFLDIRTFVNDEMLSEDQINIKNKLITFNKPFLKNHLSYYGILEDKPENINMDEFILLYAYIFHEVRPLLLELFPNMISKKINPKIRKEITDEIIWTFDNIIHHAPRKLNNLDKIKITTKNFKSEILKSSFLNVYRHIQKDLVKSVNLKT